MPLTNIYFERGNNSGEKKEICDRETWCVCVPLWRFIYIFFPSLISRVNIKCAHTYTKLIHPIPPHCSINMCCFCSQKIYRGPHTKEQKRRWNGCWCWIPAGLSSSSLWACVCVCFIKIEKENSLHGSLQNLSSETRELRENGGKRLTKNMKRALEWK